MDDGRECRAIALPRKQPVDALYMRPALSPSYGCAGTPTGTCFSLMMSSTTLRSERRMVDLVAWVLCRLANSWSIDRSMLARLRGPANDNLYTKVRRRDNAG